MPVLATILIRSQFWVMRALKPHVDNCDGSRPAQGAAHFKEALTLTDTKALLGEEPKWRMAAAMFFQPRCRTAIVIPTCKAAST